MIKRLVTAVLGICVCLTAGAVTIAPDNADIRYVGRFTDDYRFGWTGCMIEIEFAGSEISADLELVEGVAAGLTVVVDGEPRFLKVDEGRKEYLLAEGLGEGTHRIALFKRSEGSLGSVRFHGFKASDDAVLSRPQAPDRKMLVIGDSITCGYGNEAKSLDEGNTVENENGYLSYAPITARRLNADLMMFCWSGRGMYRNRQLENDQAATIPKIFDQTLPMDKVIKWDHSTFVPDVVVINLGTNDMAFQNDKKSPLPKEDFIEVYAAFISRIREFAPDSKIVISIGPMGFEPVSQWLPEIAVQFEDVSVLVYAPFADASDKGGHYHPSVKKDQHMADELVDVVKAATGWEMR